MCAKISRRCDKGTRFHSCSKFCNQSWIPACHELVPVFVVGAVFGKPLNAFLVAGAVFGEPLVPVFVAGAVFGKPLIALFVAGAVFGEPLVRVFVAGVGQTPKS